MVMVNWLIIPTPNGHDRQLELIFPADEWPVLHDQPGGWLIRSLSEATVNQFTELSSDEWPQKIN